MTSVAVCIPVYAPHLGYLEQLIESVMSQTCPVDEVLLHLDPSNRDATQRVRALAGRFGGIRLIESPRRLGMAANWNAAVRASSAELVIVPGQDDVLHPSAVRTHLDNVARGGRVQISCSNRWYIGSSGEIRKSGQRSVSADRLFIERGVYELRSSTFIKLALVYGNVTGEPCGTMFTRRLFDGIGGYDESVSHAVDLDFSIRAALADGKLLYDTRSLSYRRLHASNATNEHVRNGIAAYDRRLILNRYRSHTERWAVERARARIVSHDLYDACRRADPRGLMRAVSELTEVQPRATMREISELAGYIPQGRQWVGAEASCFYPH